MSGFFECIRVALSAAATMWAPCGADRIFIGTPIPDAAATDFSMRFKKL